MQELVDSIPSDEFLKKNKDCAEQLYQTLCELRPLILALYHMFEDSASGIYLTDGNGVMRYFNRSYERLTGLKREEIIGHHLRSLVDDKKVPYSVAMVTIERKSPVTMDLFFEATGKLLTISTTPIFDIHGTLTSVIGNVTDITTLIHTKEAPIPKSLRTSPDDGHSFASEFNVKTSMVATDEKMKWLLYYAQKAAKSNATILISGETGTGKEDMARFIFENSLRANAPFVQVNCGAIPDNLIERELFGYVGGAFTGADSKGKIGFFETANGGTIFLDEIGELPFQVQAKLLRVLQEHKITRVGSVKPITVDVRIISATNRDLISMTQAKKFREDLYYRLNVVPIALPPLRDRKVDIIPLAMKFLSDINEQYNYRLTFSPSAITAMENYGWPGNIRELKNLVERASIFCEGNVITEDLIFRDTFTNNVSISEDWNMDLSNVLQRMEFHYLEQYYKHYKNIRAAAAALNMDRSTFARKRSLYLKKFDKLK